MPKRLLTLGLISCIGCTSGPELASKSIPDIGSASQPAARNFVAEQSTPAVDPPPFQSSPETPNIDVVQSADVPAEISGGQNTPGDLSLVDYILSEEFDDETPLGLTPASPMDSIQQPAAMQSDRIIDMNLPSALAMVDAQHPAVGLARWRVQEAYARLEDAQSLWLPSIQAGFSFHHHDGNYQASDGGIVDVNRNSFQYGFGTGATGAGTTPRQGLVAQFHLADAIFQPRVAKTTAWARGHAAAATQNRQMLSAAVAYLDLVGAYQDVSILEASRQRTEELAKLTRDFAEAGEGLQADADRMQTELALNESRLIGAREQTAMASARLAEAISMDGYGQIAPLDVTVVPLQLTDANNDVGAMIGTGLAMRPELKESQALVAAACQAFKREKYAPFVPSVLLGLSAGGFGGGLGNNTDNIDGRYDMDALMSWQIRNLGVGDRAARREQSARVQQAKFEQIRVMDQVARQISEGYAQVQSRQRQIKATEQAIQFAESSYDRNLKRIRDGEGLPLEVLQSLQALETARRAYLRAVVDHNRAQFELQWAQGWPVEATM